MDSKALHEAKCVPQNLLFYLLNQGATWLKCLGGDTQAIVQMNDTFSLLNNSIKRVRGGKREGQ